MDSAAVYDSKPKSESNFVSRLSNFVFTKIGFVTHLPFVRTNIGHFHEQFLQRDGVKKKNSTVDGH